MQRNTIFSAVAAISLTLAAGPLIAEAKPAPLAQGAFTLDVQDGRLQIRANAAPLSVLIRAIGIRAGFKTETTGDLSAPVTASFADVPVIDGIGRLAGETNWAAHYTSSEGAGEPIISLLQLFGPARGVETIALRPTAPAPLPSDEDKLRAGAVLGQINTASKGAALDSLATALQTDESALVRSNAALGLGALGDERAAPLLEASLDDGNGSVRMQAANALGRIGGARATTALGEVLLHDPDRMQRIRAAWALRKQDTALARDYLAALSDDADAVVMSTVVANPSAKTMESPENTE